MKYTIAPTFHFLTNTLKKTRSKDGMQRVLLLILVYFIAARIGLGFAFIHKSASPIWLPSGVALSAVLLFGSWIWPAIFLGAFGANILALESFPAALTIALGNTLEALIAGYLVNRFARGAAAFEHPLNVFRFMILGGVLSTMISATAGTMADFFSGLADFNQLMMIWLTWWLGDACGIIIFAPLILAWFREREVPPLSYFVEFFWFMAFNLLLGVIVFSDLMFAPLVRYGFSFLIVPSLMWATLRFGRRSITTAIVLFSVIAIIGTLNGLGPFHGETVNSALLILQAFLAMLAIMTLLFCAVIERWRGAEEEVRLREKHFRSLIEKSYDIVALIDTQGRVLYMSPAVLRLAGYTPEELVGTANSELVHPDDREGTIAKFVELREKPEIPVVFEARMKRKDGVWRWMGVRGTNMINDPAVGAIVMNFRDVSERKELEKAKNDFISVVSYQLRSPLSAINSYVASLLQKTNRPFLENKYLREIERSNTKMATLVSDLLRAARIELGTFSIQPRPTDLRRAIDGVVQELLAKINGKKISIRKHYDGPHELMVLDPNFLSTVMHILLVHAIDRTPEAGHIEISTAHDGENTLIQIADNGTAISADDQSRIFQKFFVPAQELEQDRGGDGLGLYIVKSLVELAHGTVRIESREGAPTTFFVSFPCRSIKERRQGLRPKQFEQSPNKQSVVAES